MFKRWIPLRPYSLLNSSDNVTSDVSLRTRIHFAEWFTLRRVRTATITAILVLIFISFIRFSKPASSGIVSLQPTVETAHPLSGADEVQWSDFAYAQYVTNENYLCNSLMILEALFRLDTKADRIMMYPEDWQVAQDSAADAALKSRLLAQARDLYHAKLVPIQVQSFNKGDATWRESYTKLLAFNQTQYKRVMSLDSDVIVKDHMDELFLLPSSPVAMPRAYWLDQPFLSSQLVLIEPSTVEWHRVQTYMNRDDSGFDMDILNAIYKNDCVVIPHRRYNMLSAEFRSEQHEKYLGTEEAWDGHKVLEEAKFIHFSDWPVPKPWLQASDSVVDKYQPKCKKSQEGEELNCIDRDIWLGLYKEFSERRKVSEHVARNSGEED